VQEDAYKFRVKECLEESGYNVRLIDEDQTSKRADLLAECETDTLLVEVKCKYDDLELQKKLQAAEVREILPYRARVQRNNSLAAIIEKAARQIESSRSISEKAFSILWFHPDPKVGFSESDKQIRMNLYGGRYAFVDSPDDSQWCMECYYTSYSDFFRYDSLDAVALHGEQGVQLLPNTFSKRATHFKASMVYRDFERHSAIWTPELLAASGDALCLHDQVDLKDLEAVRRALEGQNPGYKIIRFIDMHSYGGVMNVDISGGRRS
jgi:hypothetical protein